MPGISTIKEVKSLQQKKYRDQKGLFVVEGEKLVGELMQSDLSVRAVYATEHWSGWKSTYPAEKVSGTELQRMSGLVQANHVLAVVEARKTLPDWRPLANKKLLLVDRMSDPGNLGTVIRTAEWFGMGAVLVSLQSVEIYNPKVVQASMGSLFRLPVFEVDLIEASRKLKSINNHFQIIAADMAGEDVRSFQWPEFGGLVIGSESHGVGQHLRESVDNFVTIAGNGKAESLNASIAAAICCYAWNSVL